MMVQYSDTDGLIRVVGVEMSRVVSVAAFIAGIIMLTGVAGAQEKGKGKTPPAASADKAGAAQASPQALSVPWLVNCASTGGEVPCEASQRLVVQKTGQLLIAVTVRIPPESKTGAMMLHLPHGLFLPDGVTLDIDGKVSKKYDVQTCDQKGCYAGLPIDDANLKMLQSGKTMTVAFRNLQKEEVRVPITLSGFKEAYAKLRQ